MYVGVGAPADPMHTESSLASASLQGSSVNQVSSWHAPKSACIHIIKGRGVNGILFSGIFQSPVFSEAPVEATQKQTASSTDATHTSSAGGSEDFGYGK